MATDKILIATENKEYIGDSINFKINPTHLTISQDTHKTMKKMRTGFTKSYVGNGLITLTFTGSLPCNPFVNSPLALTQYDPAQDDLRNSIGWQFFETFAQFVRSNQGYLFRLYYIGTPIQVRRDNPEFVGDLDVPQFDQDAENPWMINYSFTFRGELTNDDPEKDYLAEIESGLTTVEV